MLEQRKTLAELLHSLLDEKQDREDELEKYLLSVRDCRESERSNEDFWLIQYQRLLAMKPAGLVEAEQQLDNKVVEILELANAFDMIPIFARNQITYQQLLEYNEDDFKAIGVGSASYQGLQRAMIQYLAQSKLQPGIPSAPEVDNLPNVPSAPALEEPGPSAPPVDEQFTEYECVICMSEPCTVVFLPCGHACACVSCCGTLATCPMCRGEILKKILSETSRSNH